MLLHLWAWVALPKKPVSLWLHVVAAPALFTLVFTATAQASFYGYCCQDNWWGASDSTPYKVVFRVICCHRHLSKTGTLLWKPRINYRNTKMSAKKLWKTQLNIEGLNSPCRTGLTFQRACVHEALQHSEVSTTALAVPAVSDRQTGMRPAVGTPRLGMLLCIIS